MSMCILWILVAAPASIQSWFVGMQLDKNINLYKAWTRSF